ncbi:MAG: hypothetical protein ACP5VF_03565 [Acidobacteriota bacterium]
MAELLQEPAEVVKWAAVEVAFGLVVFEELEEPDDLWVRTGFGGGLTEGCVSSPVGLPLSSCYNGFQAT